MRVVFLGAPGVGKGTQADRIASQFKIARISTGDLLREAVRNQTPLGREAKQYMDQGRLVPDSVVIGLVRDKLAEDAGVNGLPPLGLRYCRYRNRCGQCQCTCQADHLKPPRIQALTEFGRPGWARGFSLTQP